MSVDEAIRILADRIAYWEEYFTQRGTYPEDYSPELSDAMEIVVEAHRKEIA